MTTGTRETGKGSKQIPFDLDKFTYGWLILAILAGVGSLVLYGVMGFLGETVNVTVPAPWVEKLGDYFVEDQWGAVTLTVTDPSTYLRLLSIVEPFAAIISGVGGAFLTLRVVTLAGQRRLTGDLATAIQRLAWYLIAAPIVVLGLSLWAETQVVAQMGITGLGFPASAVQATGPWVTASLVLFLIARALKRGAELQQDVDSVI